MKIQHIESKLHVRIQALMTFLFDVTSMTNALLEFEVSPAEENFNCFIHKFSGRLVQRVQLGRYY